MAASQTKKTCRISTGKNLFSCYQAPRIPLVSKGRRSSSPLIPFALPEKSPWVIFVTKQENLRGTNKLHAFVHIFVPRSDAQAKLADSISCYGWSFMQTNGLICGLHAKTGSAMAAGQIKNPAGYRLVKTCLLVFD